MTTPQKTAYVHVGTHKTGSTYLQTWMNTNRAHLLRTHNLYLPECGYDGEQHLPLARDMLDDKHMRSENSHFYALKDEICDLPYDLVFTCETFENRIRKRAHVDFLRDLFAECGYRLHIIGYVREQADYLNSRYAQDTRRFHWADNFRAYCERAKGEVWFNYMELFGQVIGRDDLDFSARSFPLACKTGMETDFMQVLTKNPDLTRADIDAAGYAEVGRQNEACGPLTILLSRLAQAEIARKYPQLKRRQMEKHPPWRKVKRIGIKRDWNKPGFIGMNDELAAHMRAHFKPGNEQFAQAVWGKSWAEMMSEKSFVSNELETAQLAQKDLIALMTTMHKVVGTALKNVKDGKAPKVKGKPDFAKEAKANRKLAEAMKDMGKANAAMADADNRIRTADTAIAAARARKADSAEIQQLIADKKQAELDKKAAEAAKKQAEAAKKQAESLMREAA